MSRSRGLRWLRILAIASSAIILASCKSLTTTAIVPLAAVAVAPHDAPTAPPEPIDEEGVPDDPERHGEAAGAGGVRPVGLEVPCPPLPRLQRHGRVGLRPCAAGGCGSGRCSSGQCGVACGPVGCPPPVCLPPLVPTVAPCLVCDGGDHGAPAKAVGSTGFDNLTAGDTVARYRAADAADHEEACLTTSDCACVYAPRFASVRELIRPHEDATPVGPKGLAGDALVEAQVDTLPVLGRTLLLGPELARRTQPLLAVEERLPALAVDQGDLPDESVNLENPVERIADATPVPATLVQTPRIKVGFDVPYAWTCVTAAQVTVNGQSAEVIAADQGTATLRIEEPGRCELTLCKRAGSDTARQGEELDFTIFLMNSGDRPLDDIVLVDALPKRLQLIPGSPASSLPAAISTGEGDDGSVVVTWRIEQALRPGEGGFVRFRTIVR
jgi:uncharacterized repeat protein (TIGR01451 family)